MLFVNHSTLISLTFFLPTVYLTLSYCLYLYTLPTFYTIYSSKTKKLFHIINSSSILNCTVYYLIVYVLLLTSSLFTTTSLWFNHVLVSNFQLKLVMLMVIVFFAVMKTIFNSLIFASREIYDYVISLILFFYWLSNLFFSNSIFSVIFAIEILSTLIFTLIITSTFSTTTLSNTADLSFSYLFQSTTPFSYIKSTLFFYWISLLSSLNLFFMLILFYLKFFSFDWFLLSHLMVYTYLTDTWNTLLTSYLVLIFLLISLFLKSGIAPLYIWKPLFFKGLSITNIVFYITFFYLFLFFFLINLVSSLLFNLLIKVNFVLFVFVLSGLVMVIGLLLESSYLKSFLATSSILNSLFVLLLLLSPYFVYVNDVYSI